MNKGLKGRINYSDLRQIIFDYFKENQDLELGSTSIDYLKDKLIGGNDPRPFFVVKGEFGETRFDISEEDIRKILKSYLASKNCELTSLEYGYDVVFSYDINPNISRENEEKVKLDITYDGSIKYEELRQIIFDYYKSTHGITLSSTSIDYLKNKLVGGNDPRPFFIVKGESEEKRFDISEEDIRKILESYLANKDYKLTELRFKDKVEFKYKQCKKADQKITPLPTSNSVPYFQPPKEEILLEEEPKINLEQITEPSESKTVPVKDKDLEIMAKESRRFTILQRERAMNEAQKSKNHSAIMAGLCILGAAVAVYFNDQDMNQVLQHELNSIYSWEALGQFIQDLGPITTLLAAGAGGFIAKYFKYSKKFINAQHEFEDFNASLESTNIEELGGKESAKSR